MTSDPGSWRLATKGRAFSLFWEGSVEGKIDEDVLTPSSNFASWLLVVAGGALWLRCDGSGESFGTGGFLLP